MIGDRWRTASRWFGVSTKPPASTTAASPAARMTASSVTPWARSRSGSTSTWNCWSRWPQMATFATPGTDISLGRIVHSASSVRSICESVFDQTPIFSTRLVDESGGRMTGGRATAGSRGASAASRSCTSCRARSRSVPRSKISTTDDRPEHRLRAHRLQPRHAVQRVLERHGDQALDLLGRQPGRLGLDLDQRRGELGEDVERRLRRSVDADDVSTTAHATRTTPQAERRRDEPGHHVDGPRRGRNHLPLPNSVPKSSVAPSVTTSAPGSGARANAAEAASIRSTSTRVRRKRAARFARRPTRRHGRHTGRRCLGRRDARHRRPAGWRRSRWPDRRRLSGRSIA